MEFRRQAKRLAFLLAALLAALSAVSLLFEENLIYFPSDDFDVTPRALALRHDEVFLRASDGTRIHAWFLPAPKPRTPAFTLLVCHGNAGNISHRLDRTLLLHQRLGVDVLLFDYRGFGASEGKPDEQGTYRDAIAAYRYLIDEKSVDPRRLVLFGESLGAAVAIELALREKAAALVLEAPFTSIRDMARVVYPFLPVRSLLRTHYDNLGKIPRVGLPLLIFHGRNDPTVPFEQGEALYRAAREPKTFIPIEQGTHNDAFLIGGERYWEAWEDLLGLLGSGGPTEG